MSTPSTATATHPSHHQHYGYSHHQSYQANPGSYPASSTAGHSRLTHQYPYPNSNNTSSSSNNNNNNNQVPPVSLPHSTTTKAPSHSTPMASSYQPASSASTSASKGGRKKPDWGEFYKNGVPREIIVIDDDDEEDHSESPATAAAPPPRPQTTTKRKPQPRTQAQPQLVASSMANGSTAQPANKKRRTGMESAFDLAYYDRPSHSINPQRYGDGSSGASISTDRTTSLHTTAPTSMGSHGSAGATNGVYYEDANVGQKRKRVVTRKSARDEQKRRELEAAGDAFQSYVPPPKPPIKAKEVNVPVVRHVSYPIPRFYQSLLTRY